MVTFFSHLFFYLSKLFMINDNWLLNSFVLRKIKPFLFIVFLNGIMFTCSSLLKFLPCHPSLKLFWRKSSRNVTMSPTKSTVVCCFLQLDCSVCGGGGVGDSFS